MPVLELSGVSVDFPFEPYQCQIDYMTTFLDALQTKTHALLESPTGTGKTLCLLCASLAWQESCKAQIELNRMQMRHQASSSTIQELENRLASAVGVLESDPMSNFSPFLPKVIFASRTHAQLSQAVQQLKQTAYRTAKVGIVGSRDQLCLHEEVRSLESNASKVLHCRMRVKRRACEFYNNFDANRMPESTKARSDNILDIEELVSIGRERRCCPYYMARELKQAADLLFMPYNYLLDARIRRLHNIDLQNAVVIFDEAHNIEQVCEDSASVQLSSSDLAMAIEELRMLAQELHKALSDPGESSFSFTSSSEDDLQPETHLGPVLAAKGQLLELEQVLDRQEVRKDEGLVRPGEFIFELLGEANISRATFPGLQQLLERILRSVTGSSNYRLRQATGLSKLEAFLQAVFDGSNLPGVSAFYRVFLRDVDGGKVGRQRQLCYWCFSPGRTMGELLRMGVRSLVLTSGTLYPLEAFKTGLGVPFSGELRNPHVIERRQLWLGVLQRGPDGTKLNSSYESRDNATYQASLGCAIANLARLVPNGLLVFFPSYALLQKCLAAWRSSDGDIFNRIAAHKAVIVEPRNKTEFQQAMQDFEERTRDPALPGAVFMGVARGKVSEGMDFSDHLARAVVVTGLPYAPFMDPRVKLKMNFLDEARVQSSEGLTGRAWYRQDAWRAVNQAIGRVIRHRGDFGAVLLCDERFGSAEAKLQLPAWMRADLRVFGQFGACMRDLAAFFRATGEEFPTPQLKLDRPALKGPKPVVAVPKAGPSAAVQRASDRERLGPSLSEATEAAHISLAYAGGSREAERPAEGGLMGLLERHDRQMDGRRSLSGTKRLLTPSNSQASADPLERRLEQLQKRKKLVVKAQPSSDCKNYLSRVRRVLTPEAQQQFTSALQHYKAKADLQALKRQLLQLFVFQDAPELARDFFVFVRAEQREEFAAFCREQLGMEQEEKGAEAEAEEEEKENKASSEPQCFQCAAKRRPGLVLLAPPCRHLCCFSCWRTIIEKGNKRCPSCHLMIRRRDLSRLNFEQKTESEGTSSGGPIESKASDQ